LFFPRYDYKFKLAGRISNLTREWITMRLILYFLCILPLTFICGCLILEEEKSVDVDITPEALITKMEAAVDPKGKCKQASSYILRQERITEGDSSVDKYEVASLFNREPYFFKTIIYKNQKPISITLFDGDNAWSIDPDSGSSILLSGAQLDMIRSLAKIGNPAYSYMDIFSSFEVSEVLSDMIEYYKLTCFHSYKDLTPMLVFIDSSTFLIRKITFKMTSGRRTLVDYSSFINRYEAYDDIMMPQITTVLANGVKYQYKITEFKLNVEFPPDTFKLPVPWYDRKVHKELEAARKAAVKSEQTETMAKKVNGK
jgi:outer membrane lipoprotein-sorting protein